MSNAFTLNQITNFLNNLESSASALCLVKSVYDGVEVSNHEAGEIYKSSEGENDSRRNTYIALMNDAQLVELAGHCIQILLEQVGLEHVTSLGGSV